jgi:uncharacterized protein
MKGSTSRMNFLFDIGHPAHVHLFKNFIFYLKASGHSITVTSRNKDVTIPLLDHYKIDHFQIGTPGKGLAGMAYELLCRNRQIYRLHKRLRFDAAIGTSASIGFLKLKCGVPAYNFNEDDDDVVKFYSYLSYPFATRIINPDCIRFRKWSSKRILYPSFHELAYLHPSNFKPNSDVLTKYDLAPGKYVLLRFSALRAHHDIGMRGISPELRSKIKNILSDFHIIESHELKRNNLRPWEMHHILAHAKMIISDSQTMTIEGSVLGVPSVRINTFIDKSTVITELEKKYNLAYGFYPQQGSEILNTIIYLANEAKLCQIWNERRSKLLNDKLDFNNWMIDYFKKELSI